MKKRTITIPTIPYKQQIPMNILVIAGSVLSLATGFGPLRILTSLLSALCVYSSCCRLWNKGKGVALTIGRELPAPIEPVRTPAVWPPVHAQCYICGCYDYQRQAIFGDATHPDCKEWLGGWKAPSPHYGITTAQAAQNLTTAQSPQLSVGTLREALIESSIRKRYAHSRWIEVYDRPDVQIPCTCDGPHYEIRSIEASRRDNGHRADCYCYSCRLRY